jgi:hypothetical protein
MSRSQNVDYVNSFRFAVFVDGYGPLGLTNISSLEKTIDQDGIHVNPVVIKAALWFCKDVKEILYGAFNIGDCTLNHQVEIHCGKKGDDIPTLSIPSSFVWKLKDCKVVRYACDKHDSVSKDIMFETVELTMSDFELVINI